MFGGGDKIVNFAEVDLADDLGLAIDALAIAGVVIGVAADLFGGEARRNSSSTLSIFLDKARRIV